MRPRFHSLVVATCLVLVHTSETEAQEYRRFNANQLDWRNGSDIGFVIDQSRYYGKTVDIVFDVSIRSGSVTIGVDAYTLGLLPRVRQLNRNGRVRLTIPIPSRGAHGNRSFMAVVRPDRGADFTVNSAAIRVHPIQEMERGRLRGGDFTLTYELDPSQWNSAQQRRIARALQLVHKYFLDTRVLMRAKENARLVELWNSHDYLPSMSRLEQSTLTARRIREGVTSDAWNPSEQRHLVGLALFWQQEAISRSGAFVKIESASRRHNTLGFAHVATVTLGFVRRGGELISTVETDPETRKGQFLVWLNQSPVQDQSAAELAGTIAHEMLHNLGHRHTIKDANGREIHRGSFIYEFGYALTHYASQAE